MVGGNLAKITEVGQRQMQGSESKEFTEPDMIYENMIDLTSVQEKAITMSLAQILEKVWKYDRTRQGLEYAKPKGYKKSLTKCMIEHMFWLMVLESHVTSIVLSKDDE